MARVMSDNQVILAKYLLTVGCTPSEMIEITYSVWEEDKTIKMLEFCRDNPIASPDELL